MNSEFPNLSVNWFHKHCIRTDPAEAAKEWDEWIASKPRTDEQKYRKALSLATGLHEASIRHYLKRPDKLSDLTLTTLDSLTAALGRTPPEERTSETRQVGRRGNRIALLVELTSIPSPPFHLQVIRGIVRGASRHHFSVSMHEVSGDPLANAIKRVASIYRPDAMVMLRLTPNRETASVLGRADIPVVLVHADRLEYPSPPFVANIVPGQEPIEECLSGWAKNLADWHAARTRSSGGQNSEIIVVALGPEKTKHDYPPLHPVPHIRKERIDLVKKALEELQELKKIKLVDYQVPDYSFRHALSVYRKHPKALGYVCLSDEIAVGIKHAMIANRGEKEWKRRIIGFDNSWLAREEEITSFGQHLEDIGDLAVEKLAEQLTGLRRSPENWTKFRQIRTDVYLVPR